MARWPPVKLTFDTSSVTKCSTSSTTAKRCQPIWWGASWLHFQRSNNWAWAYLLSGPWTTIPRGELVYNYSLPIPLFLLFFFWILSCKVYRGPAFSSSTSELLTLQFSGLQISIFSLQWLKSLMRKPQVTSLQKWKLLECPGVSSPQWWTWRCDMRFPLKKLLISP